MHCVRTRQFRDTNNLINGKISLNRAHAFADAVSLVGLKPMEPQLVLFRKDSDRLFAHFVGCTHNPDGNLAAVCDEDFLEFGHLVAPSVTSFCHVLIG